MPYYVAFLLFALSSSLTAQQVREDLYLYYSPQSLKAQRVLEFCMSNEVVLSLREVSDPKGPASIEMESSAEELFQKLSYDLETFQKEEGVVLTFKEIDQTSKLLSEELIVGAEPIIAFLMHEITSVQPEYYDSE